MESLRFDQYKCVENIIYKVSFADVQTEKARLLLQWQKLLWQSAIPSVGSFFSGDKYNAQDQHCYAKYTKEESEPQGHFFKERTG